MNFDNVEPRLQALLERWFVQFNPFYFASALCVLGGAYLATQGLEEAGVSNGDLWVSVVLEVYQCCVLVALSLLARRAKQIRSAVILTILLVVVMGDATLQAENLAPAQPVLLSAVWVGMFVSKIAVVGWALKLRINLATLVIAALGFSGVAFVPHALHHAEAVSLPVEGLLTIAIWHLTGVTALTMFWKPTVESKVPLDDWGQTVLRRSVRAAWAIWAGFYVYHGVMWALAYGAVPSIAMAAPPLLLATLRATREGWVWLGSVAALIVAAFDPTTVAVAATVAALVHLLMARRLERPRLYVGVVLFLHGALRSFGWEQLGLGAVLTALQGAAFIAYAALAKWFRLISAWVLAGLTAFFVARRLLPAAPNATTEWAITLILGGFVALFVGVGLNFRVARSNDAQPHIRVV